MHRYQAPFQAIEFFESAYSPFSVAFSLASGLNSGNKNDKYQRYYGSGKLYNQMCNYCDYLALFRTVCSPAKLRVRPSRIACPAGEQTGLADSMGVWTGESDRDQFGCLPCQPNRPLSGSHPNTSDTIKFAENGEGSYAAMANT